MCAALSAVEQGARVLLVERGPERDRGGNSKYTRNIRCASDVYPEAELFSDLVGVTGEEIDLELARFAIAQSREAPAWMESHGVRWQPAFRGTMHLDRTNKFFLGGGKALLNVYYRELAARGIPVRYDDAADGDRAGRRRRLHGDGRARRRERADLGARARDRERRL